MDNTQQDAPEILGNLTNYFFSELLKAPELPNKVNQYIKRTTSSRYAINCYNIGIMYYFGLEGVSVNISKAVECYKVAAELGYDKAQNQLGLMYCYGDGVAKNFNKAKKLFKKAAKQGNLCAMCNLGDLYYRGYGVKQSHDKATVLYMKSAERGLPRAQQNLGIMYWKGQGLFKNLSIVQRIYSATYWFKKASYNGNKYAKIFLKKNGLIVIP